VNRFFISGAAALCFAFGASVHAAGNPAIGKPAPPMGKQQYEAAKARIAAQLKADMKLCAALKGDKREVCDAQAEGREKAEKAQLEARYKPSPENSLEAKVATAEANYDVAKAKCDLLKGKAEKRCEKEAKAAKEAAIRQARVEKVEATGGIFGEGAARKPADAAGKS
jgi:hypothetical protein